MNGPPVGERWSDRHAGLFVVLLACIAHAAALAGTFVYDDIHSVADNPAIRSLSGIGRFFVDPTTFSAAGNVMYRPVLLCTFAFDHALGGGSALAFKGTSVGLHALVALLLFGWLRGMGTARVAAAVAAGLFAVHPMTSEAVNMVSARSEVLCLLGVLLALRGHLGLLAGGRAAGAAVALGAMLACGSKETGALLPALLFGQEWLRRGWPRTGAAWRGLVARLLPAVAVVVGYLLARKLLLGDATAALLDRDGSDPRYGHTRDLATQLCTMAAALPRLLVQVAWPARLTLDPEVAYYRTPWALPVLSGVLGLVALLAVGLRAPRQRPRQVFGIAFACALSLPWIVIPLNQPVAEHRCYGLLAGLAIASAPLLERWCHAGSRARRWWPAVPLLLAAAASGWRALDYRDERELWRSALTVQPTSFRANWGLGAACMLHGDFAGAEPWLARAVAIYPGFRTARRSWVECLLQLPAAEGWCYRALAAAEELSQQKPDDPYYRILHANALLQCGIAAADPARLRSAEDVALSCLSIAPPKALVFRIAARCRQELGDHAGALAHFDAALAQGLDFPSLRVERAEVLRTLGQAEAADRELRAAFARAPMDAAVRAAYGRRYAAPPR